MPASQIDVKPLKRFDHLMNVPLKVMLHVLIKLEVTFVQAEEQF